MTVAGHAQWRNGGKRRWHGIPRPPFGPCSGGRASHCLSASILPSRAADPQPYEVTLKPTGDKSLDSALHDASTLISLEKKAPVGGFALVERARQDTDRLRTVLHSFGYYKGRVDITIAGHKLSDIRRCRA